jgi:hypothetical protein
MILWQRHMVSDRFWLQVLGHAVDYAGLAVLP